MEKCSDGGICGLGGYCQDCNISKISFDDHYTGKDFNYWSGALVEIGNHFGEYIRPSWGWNDPFSEGKTPIQAFLEEYPEYSEEYQKIE